MRYVFYEASYWVHRGYTKDYAIVRLHSNTSSDVIFRAWGKVDQTGQVKIDVSTNASFLVDKFEKERAAKGYFRVVQVRTKCSGDFMASIAKHFDPAYAERSKVRFESLVGSKEFSNHFSRIMDASRGNSEPEQVFVAKSVIAVSSIDNKEWGAW
ncbi:hypothetical protein [Ectothiorhodospira shaposhnikovii]|uniref:hypothetical protein n=1 Tax=Ectothiorhodospira shaposhnikovii TaxID=1054 RepID=UPI001EE95671|nr:hypothetical protein [Ectothiorhodospira shaposhnikovii]MCG5512879.1 hypothetical protein [Ectothiorhodospira shaposhnikovii]